MKNTSRFPIAFQAEVKSGLKLALFLAGLRTYIDQAAPGMLQWKTLKHQGEPYVKISPTARGRNQLGGVDQNLAIHYRSTGKQFTITLNEGVLKRSIERDLARQKAKTQQTKPPKNTKLAKTKTKPWLGSNMALQVDRNALEILEVLYHDDYQQIMQSRAWANLPILNAWKRQFPSQDPLAFHQKHWNARLRCPGGGSYVWNEKYQTMESTVYGHPGGSKIGPKFPAALSVLKSVNFGVTFENKGLRARMVLERKAPTAK
jgi:hypothetical protein